MVKLNIPNSDRAQVLMEALPYIRKYTDKIVVIKYGGNAMLSEEAKQTVMGDIALLTLIGIKAVLIHGGGPEITDFMQRIGKEPKFIDGLRVTDKETAEITQMVLAGKINKNLVALINCMGGNAIGLSGIDGQLITARQYDERLGFVGEITDVNTTPLLDLLDKGYIPVISTVGCDTEGNVYNINADTAAARVAGALKAESLLTMTDAPGLMRDVSDPETLISVVHASEAPALMHDGIIQGGMIPKVECCIEAIRRGVKRVFIIDGRVPHSILIEMLTDEGMGTMFI